MRHTRPSLGAARRLGEGRELVLKRGAGRVGIEDAVALFGALAAVVLALFVSASEG